jgi:hypothetical protein
MPGQLQLFGGPRQRGRAAPAPKEFNLHCQVADTLERWCSPQWRYTHIPLGEYRTPQTAGRLKRMGVTAGWPDFLFTGPHRQTVFLELKRRNLGLSTAQKKIVEHLTSCGFTVLRSDSFGEILTLLGDLGVLRRAISVQ